MLLATADQVIQYMPSSTRSTILLSRRTRAETDYGASTGLRLAMKHPAKCIIAIITQNGNAYVEGLIKEWEPGQGHRQGIYAAQLFLGNCPRDERLRVSALSK